MTEPIPIRKRYYNPVLDRRTQDTKMTEKMREAALDGRYNDGTSKGGGPLNVPDESHPVNLVSSLCEDGLHRPALDVDLPCELFPSSREGHFHLYFPTVALTWEKYVALLEALVAAGIVEAAYYHASVNRGQTLLRPPGVTK